MQKSVAVLSPSKFPGISGDSANYTELIGALVKYGYRVLLICPWNFLMKSHDKNMAKKGVIVARVPIVPPRITDFSGSLISMLFRLLAFYLVSIILFSFLFIRYRIRTVIVRHSILMMPVLVIFRMFRVFSIADGELFSESRVLPISSTFWHILTIFEALMVRRYSVYSIPNEAQREKILRLGFPKERIIQREIRVDLSKIPIHNIASIPNRTFGYFGSLEKWQDVELLIRSFFLVLQQKPDSKLFIIGDGSQKVSLKKLVKKKQATKNVIFFEGVSREELWINYFNKFRIAVIPRSGTIYTENSSIKLVEALGAGKPTIATKVPGILKIVEDKDGIILVDPNNIKLLSNAMLKLVDNSPLLFELSERALKASKRFNIDGNLDVFQKLLDV